MVLNIVQWLSELYISLVIRLFTSRVYSDKREKIWPDKPHILFDVQLGTHVTERLNGN